MNKTITIILALLIFLTLSQGEMNQDSIRVQDDFNLLFGDGKYDLQSPIKSGTPLLLNINRNKHFLTPEQLRVFEEKSKSRPTRPEHYYTPEGHYKIHYSSTEVDTYYVRRCGEFFERSWSNEVDSLGFLPPVCDDTLGGDDKFDVYIFPLGWVYGMTMWDDLEGPAPWHDVSAYIEVNTSYDVFPENEDPEGSAWGAFKVTAAHEFFHAVQFAYDPDERVWLLEVASVWMEDVVFDYVNDYYNYLGDFYDEPWTSIMEESMHMYGSNIWFHYLNSRFGVGIIHGIFEQMIYEDGFTAISLALDSASANLAEEYLGFECWNYLTGSRADSFHYEEAFAYPEIFIEERATSLPFSFEPSYGHQPRSFGANYLEIDDTTATALYIDLSGAPGAEWQIGAVIPGDSAKILIPSDCGVVITARNPVALVIVPLGIYSASATYDYSINIQAYDELIVDAGDDTTIEPGDSVILGGSPTLSGGIPPYSYQWTPSASLDDSTTANPIAFPETTTTYALTATDAIGYTMKDSVTIFVENMIAETNKPEAIEISAYPNPFNSSCRIQVSGVSEQVSGIKIYDLRGRLVWERHVETRHAVSLQNGAREFIWHPSKIPAGIYIANFDGNSIKILFIP